MTRQELSKTLGLSCVEKYFLAWLKNNYNVTKMYANSFISLDQLLEDFKRGAKYETYMGVERIQDTAEKHGIVTHSFEQIPTEQALKQVSIQSESELVLFRSSPSFFTGRNRIPWRKDHYIYIDHSLRWLNEYPLTEGRFSEEEFNCAYGGSVLRFQLNAQREDKALMDENLYKINEQQFNNIPELEIKSYENIVGILRTTRKRMALFYEENIDAQNLFRMELHLLDQTYFIIHKILVTGTTQDTTVIRNKLLEVQNFEKKLKEIFYDKTENRSNN